MQVKQNQDIVDQERLLGKLPFAAGASFDSYHRQHERQCMEDTRVGLLQQFQEWGANHSRPLFWVSGMAGTGKSTIARTLANRFKSSGTLGGSFFFSRASGEANNAFKLVGTLAHHLANALPHLKGPLCEAILNHEDVVRQGLRNQWKELIVTPLSNVRLNGRPTLNIVIDALDECGSDDDIRLILQLFVEVKDLKSIDMGIFVTSRPEIVIRLGFANIPDIVHQKLDLRDIPRDDVEHDIMVFLESELRCISLQRKLHDWPSKHAIGVLVKRSDCLFIYATTACRYIGGMDWDPEERLSEILSGGSSGEGDAITGIDAMYMQVLRTALTEGRGQKEVDKLCDRFKQVVGSIVVLFDELSISALAGLLSLQENSVKLSLDGLHSVLNVLDDTDSPVRLLHPSFHDFLVDYRRCEDGRFCVDEASMHGELAKNCLRVISTALKRNMCQLSTPGAPPQEAERHTLNIQLPRHVQYACSYWVDHLASTKPDSRLQIGFCDNGEVHLFFQKDFLRWLEAMSLMEKMPQAVLMIQKLANILEVCYPA